VARHVFVRAHLFVLLHLCMQAHGPGAEQAWAKEHRTKQGSPLLNDPFVLWLHPHSLREKPSDAQRRCLSQLLDF